MNWVQLLQPIYTSIVSIVLGFLIGRIKKLKSSTQAANEALGALLRNAMFDIYDLYRDTETVPADIQEEMDSLYKAYHGLGFNNMGTKIHDEIMSKKTKTK